MLWKGKKTSSPRSITERKGEGVLKGASGRGPVTVLIENHRHPEPWGKGGFYREGSPYKKKRAASLKARDSKGKGVPVEPMGDLGDVQKGSPPPSASTGREVPHPGKSYHLTKRGVFRGDN